MDLADVKFTDTEGSDHEGDTFEDAPNTAVTKPKLQHKRSRSNASTRSLTDRRDSSSKPADKRPPTINSSRRPSESQSQLEEVTPRVSRPSTMSSEKDMDSLDNELISPKGNVIEMDDEPLESPPLLTARRVSRFDEVQLSEAREKSDAEEVRGRQIRVDSNTADRVADRSHSRSSASGSQPQGPYTRTSNPPATMAPPPAPAPLPKQVTATATTRKLSSPFSWLSRKKSAAAGSASPPQPIPRRHTAATANDFGSNSDFMLSRLDEDKVREGRIPGKDQLRERFKVLRMKEEAGISLEDSAEFRNSASSTSGLLQNLARSQNDVGLGIRGSPRQEDPASPQPSENDAQFDRIISRSNSVASVHFDPSLAPGTVSGISSGPSAMQDPESPVDWDLWQSVVYDGPAAVAKTSAAELNRAIASGIPSAIRGVVWQVLAQSKNEDLEGVYRELVARGTDKEKEFGSPNVSSGPQSANSFLSNGTQKESVASSASSVHSETSTPATTNGVASPIMSPDMDAINATAKAQATVERQKKAKEDLAAVKKLEKTIRKDLGSRSNYSKYAAAAGLQEGLFGVCKAYALFDEGVGYAQGMNFIVMPLLFNMPEEEAFCLLVRLMNQYGLREMFIQDMPGLHLHLYQFERLLEDVEPALCYHLHKRGITPSLYATQWFLTLFAYRFPLQLVLRVYDLILSEGLEGAILKFGIALMQKNADVLLATHDMTALKNFLNERLFDVYIDTAPSANSILESGFFGNSGGAEKEVYRADLMVQDACAVKITPEFLKAYTSDYETRIRLEKERETEFESLRSANASLAAKIRSLEQRAEKSDTDHVQMATEMIRSKMETEELKSANVDLQAVIVELNEKIKTQPEEVELRLKDEMDRIMARNIEVQNENRALEESMADMERDLVETKMRFAQINGDHDTLKQKWLDLRRALGD